MFGLLIHKWIMNGRAVYFSGAAGPGYLIFYKKVSRSHSGSHKIMHHKPPLKSISPPPSLLPQPDSTYTFGLKCGKARRRSLVDQVCTKDRVGQLQHSLAMGSLSVLTFCWPMGLLAENKNKKMNRSE